MAGVLAGPVFLADSLWLDFVNSRLRDSSGPRDFAGTPRTMLDWLMAAGQLTELDRDGVKKGLAAKWFAAGSALRDELAHLADSVCKGNPAPKSSVRAINQVLSEQDGCFQLISVERGFVERFVPARPSSPLVAIAQSAANFVAGGDHELLKRCGNETCVLMFHDKTKNHRRKFCSAEGCGNRVKVAAHYRRKRDAAIT